MHRGTHVSSFQSFPVQETTVSTVRNSSFQLWKLQFPTLETPVPSLETVISPTDTHCSCKQRDYQSTLGVADTLSATHLQQVSATLQTTENKQDELILLQMADVFYFFKLYRG